MNAASSPNRLHWRLRQQGHSYTKSRQLVFQAIALLGPCTRPAVVKRLEGKVDRASVYRAIDVFIELDIAHVVRYRLIELSDPFRQHHHHFVCRQCGQESNFNDDRLEQALEAFAKDRGITLESHQVELSGLCRQCSPRA
ncbi:MAG: transcriptional regulator, Fur family transcriptional regulator, ferric uptake regulator [Candidatus Saccharibacteria bacterium]|jgi:Fur family ferric uptake transcriptional regulator|nr:transcriptional regulator, Fur family transcriptional regulator, ferric uptake regulator [Candidatus Saccharibacteria bacterium]